MIKLNLLIILFLSFLVSAPLCAAESTIGQININEVEGAGATSSAYSIEKLKRMKNKADGQEEQLPATTATIPDRSPSFGKMFQGLALCLGVFFILIYIMRKLNMKVQGDSDSRLNIVERISLGGKNSIMIVRCDSKEVLLAVNEESIVQIFNEQRMPMIRQASKAQNEIKKAVPCINE